MALYLSFAIAAKETKSLGRKDIQPLPAMQLCGTAVLLWLRLLIFIVRLQYKHCLDLPAVDTFNFMVVFIKVGSKVLQLIAYEITCTDCT